MIYLDNAATTRQKPAAVFRAVERGLREFSANPGRGGHTFSLRAAEQMYAARKKAAAFFGASGPEAVVFTLNCTHSINCVIKGITKPGDRVVTSNLEHNAVMRPLASHGVRIETVAVSQDDAVTLEAFRQAITADTALVICTMASNVTGKILPIAAIGQLCRSKGVPFAVDAAQAAGVLPIHMRQMGIDYLCVAPHKGLYAPMGIGLLLCEKPIAFPLIEGGTGVNSADLFQPQNLPERLESGTLSPALAMGVAAGIDFVAARGTETIYAHETDLCERLYNGLAEVPGMERIAPSFKRGNYAPVVSFNVPGHTSEETAAYLNEKGIAVRGGLHCAPAAHRALGTIDRGAVRASVSVFTAPAEISALLRAVKSYKKL